MKEIIIWQSVGGPDGALGEIRVARFGLFEAEKTNLDFLKIGWHRNFREFIK